MEKNRNSNIELLRIICICFVIIQHFCENSALGAFSYAMQSGITNLAILRCAYSISRVAVNVFVIISGYFMISINKRTIGKPLVLYLQMICYGVLLYAVEVLQTGTGTIKHLLKIIVIPQNYYVMLYITLYCISPFANKMVTVLSKKQYKNLIVILFVLFGVYSTCINTLLQLLGESNIVGAYTVSLTGTGRGFSIVGFVFMYLIGGYIKLYGLNMKTRTRILCLALSVFISTLISVCIPSIAGIMMNYDSIFVIVQAALLFSIFLDVDIKSKTVNFIAKSSFGVFLLHYPILKQVASALNMKGMCSETISSLIICLLESVVGTYVICVCLDVVLRFIVQPLKVKLTSSRLFRTSITALDE